MNRFDEVTGVALTGLSPKKDFGVPMPGDPSVMYTLQKNQLAPLAEKFGDQLGYYQTGKFEQKERVMRKLSSSDDGQPEEEDNQGGVEQI